MNEIIFGSGNRKVKVKSNALSLKDFYKRRNKVLVLRDSGGLGDILMLRMIFEDIKRVMPDSQINVAIPTNYNRAMFWHPYVDKVVNSKEVNENEFGAYYNVTTACVRYEMKVRPKFDLHRAEIWSAHCGFRLTKSNMHLRLPKLLESYAKKKLQDKVKARKKGYVCFCPISAMASKDLDEQQINEVLSGLKAMGYTPFILHYKAIPGVDCTVFGAPHDEWLALMSVADYVITVDTAAFHASNGFQKPTVAIFSWADGKVYTKFHEKCILIQRHRDHTPGWTCGPCYDHPRCPKTSEPRKPCITEITSGEILEAFEQLVNRYPISDDRGHTRQPSSDSLNMNQIDGKEMTDTQTPAHRTLTLPVL